MINEIYTWLHTQITTNDVFAGLIGGSFLVSAFYSLKSVPQYLWKMYMFNCTTYLTVRDVDDSFQWFDEWLARQSFTKKARRLTLVTKRNDEDETGDHWNLTLGHGTHYFWYRGRFVVAERSLDDADKIGQRRETLNIRIITRNRGVIRQLVTDVRDQREKKDSLIIYTSSGGWWNKTGVKLTRSLDSVILPKGQMKKFIQNIDWFRGAKQWYIDRGIPYRYGILLSGEPGCGKTSIVSALASHYQMPIYAMNLGSFEEDSDLLSVMSSVPSSCILLIEDIDSVTATGSRETDKKEPDKKSITLGALLNSIDGVMATEGRIMIMTTNYPEKLDSALIRPGRIDLHETIGKLGIEEANRMFRRFFPDTNITIEEYVPMTPAKLQGVMMQNIHSPQEVRRILREYKIATDRIPESNSQDTLCQMD